MNELRNNAAGGRLGVIDAIGMGWRLLSSDFWMLWVLGIVFSVVTGGSGVIACLLCCLLPFVPFFVGSPMAAGLFRAVCRRVDGGVVNIADLFSAFGPHYWQIVIAGLPVAGIELISGATEVGVRLSANTGPMMMKELSSEGIAIGLIVVVVLIGLFLMLLLAVLKLFFTFALLAIWEKPTSGADAIKASMQLVRQNLLPMVGLVLLFGLLNLAAVIVGLLGLCVGIFITLPAVAVWYHITLIYLYRSWRGQPLVQSATG